MKHVLPLLALTALVACGEPASAPLPKSETAIPVRVAPITQHTQLPPITASGIVAHKESITLSFKVGGIIQSIPVDEGNTIQKGQIIAQLNPQEINARVTQAQSATDKATRDLKRIKKLYQDHVVTHEQFQNATTALKMAIAELQIAKFNQQHAFIHAPESGRVLRRFAERNELVSPGTPILQIASTTQHPILRLGLSDKNIVNITLGDTATVTFDPYPNKTFQATVSEIAAQAHPQTGTFEVELTLKNASTLKAGFIGQATLTPTTQTPHYRIPMDAIVEANKSTITIYIPNNKTAKRLTLTPNHIANHYITVNKTSNLTLTQIITEGAPYLRDQSPILIQ